MGIVLYEIINLKPSFRAQNIEGLYNKVIKGQLNKIPERFSNELFEIVKLLMIMFKKELNILNHLEENK